MSPAVCAAHCGLPLDLTRQHYTVTRTLETVEHGGEIQPVDGDEIAYVHIGCWPRGAVLIHGTAGFPDTAIVRPAVTS